MDFKIHYVKIGLSVATLVAIDRISKLLIVLYLKGQMFFFPYVSFRYEKNTGIAWSIPIPHQILLPINIILLSVIPWLAYRYLDFRKVLSILAVILIMAGGIGNVYDRIAHGYVIDFISIGQWPVFNLADAFLTTGIFIILFFYGKIKRV